MNTEIFTGRAEKLQVRLQELLAGAATTIDQVVSTTQNGIYIIIWS